MAARGEPRRVRRPLWPPSGGRPLERGLLAGLALLRGLALSALQGAPGLGEEDVVQARLVELKVRNVHVRLIEGTDDAGELLAAVPREPHRGALRRARDELPERAEQLHGP